MSDRGLTDLTNVLLTAAGAGLALACGYLVMKPATRTLKKWIGASLVALPGLLLGVALAHPQLGVRSAYGGLTEALLGSSAPSTGDRDVPQPVGAPRASSPDGGTSGVDGPSLSPSGDSIAAESPDGTDDPSDQGSGEQAPSTPPEESPSTPPDTTESTTPPSPGPSETGTSPPPTPSETETSPPPSSPPPTSEPPPPPPTESEPPPPPPPTSEPPPPPPPEPSPS